MEQTLPLCLFGFEIIVGVMFTFDVGGGPGTLKLFNGCPCPLVAAFGTSIDRPGAYVMLGLLKMQIIITVNVDAFIMRMVRSLLPVVRRH